MLYFVKIGSCYLEISKVNNITDEYIEADVNWYTKPGKTFLRSEQNIRISKKAMKNWEKVKK